MNFRLKTSKETGDKLVALQKYTGLNWNILSRISVALSLRIPSIPDPVSNRNGIEIPRNVMTGEHDYTYKAIIRQHSKRNVPDEEYFPDLFNAHLERGVKLLENEYKHAGNYDKLLMNLLNIDK